MRRAVPFDVAAMDDLYRSLDFIERHYIAYRVGYPSTRALRAKNYGCRDQWAAIYCIYITTIDAA
jgi:hypothetical protein